MGQPKATKRSAEGRRRKERTMSRATKEDWLEGPGDLEEAVVEDVPTKGKSVKVRALPAKFSNDAQSEATETRTTGDGVALVTVNKAKLEILQFTHGVVEPAVSKDEAEKIAERYAGAFFKVIEKIDELSAIDKEAIEQAEARFPGVPDEASAKAPPNGGDPASAGSGRSDVPVRAGAGDGDAG